MIDYEIQGRNGGKFYGIYEIYVGPRGGTITKKLIKKVPEYLKHTLYPLLKDLKRSNNVLV